jgi:hypothetical protein
MVWEKAKVNPKSHGFLAWGWGQNITTVLFPPSVHQFWIFQCPRRPKNSLSNYGDFCIHWKKLDFTHCGRVVWPACGNPPKCWFRFYHIVISIISNITVCTVNTHQRCWHTINLCLTLIRARQCGLAPNSRVITSPFVDYQIPQYALWRANPHTMSLLRLHTLTANFTTYQYSLISRLSQPTHTSIFRLIILFTYLGGGPMLRTAWLVLQDLYSVFFLLTCTAIPPIK